MICRQLSSLLVLTLLVIFNLQAQKTYHFGAVVKPYFYQQSRDERVKAYQRIVDSLSKKTGVSIKLHPFSSYREMISATEKNDIDMAYYKTGDYLQSLIDNGKLSALVTVLTNHKDYYKTYIVTKDPALNTLDALKHKSMGLNAGWLSLSGQVYPLMYLHKHHIDPTNYFSSLKLYDGDLCTIKALYNNKVDAITVWDDSFLKNIKGHQKYHIIARMGKIPNPVIVASSKMTRSEKKKMIKGLLKLPPQAFKGLTFSGTEHYHLEHYQKALLLVKRARQYYPSLYSKIDKAPLQNDFSRCV